MWKIRKFSLQSGLELMDGFAQIPCQTEARCIQGDPGRPSNSKL